MPELLSNPALAAQPCDFNVTDHPVPSTEPALNTHRIHTVKLFEGKRSPHIILRNNQYDLQAACKYSLHGKELVLSGELPALLSKAASYSNTFNRFLCEERGLYTVITPNSSAA